MIKVVGKKAEEPKIYNVTCDECGAQLECEEPDTYVGAHGWHYVKCPECGDEALVEEMKDIVLTEHNINFPKHFRKVSNGAINIGDYQIQEWVRECVADIKKNKDDDFWIISSGNTVIIVLEWEDEYEVYVAKNYWNSIVPKG